MLFKKTTFEPDNVCRDPGGGPAHPRETAMRYDVIAFCDDELVLIMQRLRRRADEIEQSFATCWYVCAVLNVVRRPEAFRRNVVTLVKHCLECVEHDCLISLWG